MNNSEKLLKKFFEVSAGFTVREIIAACLLMLGGCVRHTIPPELLGEFSEALKKDLDKVIYHAKETSTKTPSRPE